MRRKADGVTTSARSTEQPRRKNKAAGVYTITDLSTGQVISKFRARKQKDIDYQLQIVTIGLKRDISEFKLDYITDWEDA